jgi:hypothetical protein
LIPHASGGVSIQAHDQVDDRRLAMRLERFFGKLTKVSGGRLNDARGAARIVDDD